MRRADVGRAVPGLTLLDPIVAYKCARCLRLQIIPPLEEGQPNPECPWCGHPITLYQPLHGPRPKDSR